MRVMCGQSATEEPWRLQQLQSALRRTLRHRRDSYVGARRVDSSATDGRTETRPVLTSTMRRRKSINGRHRSVNSRLNSFAKSELTTYLVVGRSSHNSNSNKEEDPITAQHGRAVQHRCRHRHERGTAANNRELVTVAVPRQTGRQSVQWSAVGVVAEALDKIVHRHLHLA
jgi:hypothetical protein